MSDFRKKKNNASKKTLTVIITLSVLFVVSVSFILFKDNISNLETLEIQDKTRNTVKAGITVTKDSDLIIPVSDITEKAKFYPVEINGTKLEVLAVKAPDGTVRTAFNTCQVCYSSGRGYYVQEGSALVCQNCGNRFV